jgi:hypothetical protein
MSRVLSPASDTCTCSSVIFCCVLLQTGTKVKASDKFSFPLALDLGAFVSPTEGDHPLCRMCSMSMHLRHGLQSQLQCNARHLQKQRDDPPCT